VRAAPASQAPVRGRPRRSPARAQRLSDTVALRDAGLSGPAADARLELVRSQGLRLLRGAGGLALKAVRLPESTTRIVAAFLPLTRLMAQPTHIGAQELSHEVDRIFAALYQHPLTEQTRRFTTYLP
jgi:hypothetical protein